MDTLLRNYDLAVTASTAAVLLVLDAPWPLWAAWGAILTFQLGNRLWRRRTRD